MERNVLLDILSSHNPFTMIRSQKTVGALVNHPSSADVKDVQGETEFQL
jgi:hypothetical protein